MKNLTGTAVDLKEKEGGSMTNYKIKKYFINHLIQFAM